MATEDTLLALLLSLPDQAFENELDFTRKVVPHFVRLLGFDEAETFYEYGGADRYRADVVLSRSITSRPWIVVELKRSRPRNVGDWVYQVKSYLNAFNCRIGVVLSPELLLVIEPGGTKRYELRSINSAQVQEILRALGRQVQPLTDDEPRHGKLVELVEAVDEATTNDAKGKTLESLANFLFNSVPSLKCKYANLQTRSSEIDLVVEYNPSKERIPIFEELGRYCLVECKNWSKPVGVGPVRDFMGKLDKCKVRLGVIFSKNGITGIDSGVDALREIQSRFDRDGTYLLVFSLDDLKEIKDGRAFAIALDRKADNLRFDAQGC